MNRGLRETDKVAPERLLRLIGELVRELNPTQADDARITVDSLLDRDLGFDSLTRVELVARVEREFGVRLADDVFATGETPADLIAAIRSSSSEAIQFLDAPAPQQAASPEVDLVDALTLTDVVDRYATEHPNRRHIVLYDDASEGSALSYGGLRSAALEVATGLQHARVEPGDRVAIMLPTGEDYFLAFFGVLYAGAIPVPIYPPVRASQLESHLAHQCKILDNCKARALIAFREARVPAQLLLGQVESLRAVTTVPELRARGTTLSRVPLNASDTGLIQYTSGSTGDPKGVVLSHQNLLANIRADGAGVDASPRDVFVSWLPLYHDMGLIGAWLGSLYHGVVLVSMSPLHFLSRPIRWLQAIHRYRGTLSAGPNFAYELCMRHVDDDALRALDLSCWRVALNGAEPVLPDTVRRFTERFARSGFDPKAMFPVYGLAESAVGLAFPPLGRVPRIDRVDRTRLARDSIAEPADPGDTDAVEFTSTGFPLPGHELRVVDEKNRELPERREGRLQFRGPSATAGYFDNPAASSALRVGAWLETGDRAYLADGELFVTGRTKDLVIRGGRNIHPHEVEQVVGALDGVRRGCVAAFGVQDRNPGTERLVVVAETRTTAADALRKIRSRVNAVVAGMLGAPPDTIELVPPGSVPKTSSGKIRRSSCRELYASGKLGPEAAPIWRQALTLAVSGFGRRCRKAAASGREWAFASWSWTSFGTLMTLVWFGVLALPTVSSRWRLMRGALRLFAASTGTRFAVEGVEHLPSGRPFVLASNHQSYLDALALIAALPVPVVFVAKAELAKQFFAGTFLKRIGTQFVERFDSGRSASDADQLVELASEGHSLVFFPEGTFTRREGLLPFRMGAFIVAARSGQPVLPVALHGTRQVLRDGSWYPRKGAIRVSIGHPIEPAPTGEGVWNQATKMRANARGFILRHCREPDLANSRPFAEAGSRAA